MSYQGTFNHILDRLYRKRTSWLRTVLCEANPGRVPILVKKNRERAIRELQGVASDALARKMARREFRRSVKKRKSWRTKGRSTEEKRMAFRAWVRRKIDSKGGKVYVFWQKKRCCYVGRTSGTGQRPARHFKRSWFQAATRIDVYMAPRKRDIPRLECLAVHQFLPARNKLKAAKENWTPKCPLCALHKKIKTDLRRVYRFR